MWAFAEGPNDARNNTILHLLNKSEKVRVALIEFWKKNKNKPSWKKRIPQEYVVKCLQS